MVARETMSVGKNQKIGGLANLRAGKRVLGIHYVTDNGLRISGVHCRDKAELCNKYHITNLSNRD